MQCQPLPSINSTLNSLSSCFTCSSRTPLQISHQMAKQKLPCFMFILLVASSLGFINGGKAEQMVPAMFVFGDSLVDVGNNNYLPLSIAKADFPHNGLDFPTHKPTGRFCNGKNAADFLAEKLGVVSAPPYLKMVRNKNNSFVNGVSFASGGAGIFDGTDQLYRQSITMNKQIQYFAAVQAQMVKQLGQNDAQSILSKSIIAIVIGSNDILGYFGSHSNLPKKSTPQVYVDSMVSTIKAQLKSIYDTGGRKFVMIGIGAVGCCPSQRDQNRTGDCNAAANYWASYYNKGLQSVLKDYQAELKDFKYTYFDTYSVMLNLIQQPSSYGFTEVKAACCGLGKLNAKVACTPISSYCPNRNDHVFWDLYHPTEAAARIIINAAFDGPPQYSFPFNVRQLASL